MKNRHKFTWRNRLQYHFDNFMSKGGISVFLALLLIFVIAFLVMTGFRYLSEWLFPNQNLHDYNELPWDIFEQLIGLKDTGDHINSATKFISVMTIIIGLILFSSLVAFITNEFETRLQLLKKGKSIVVEENHTLILGFNEKVTDIINELIIANESEKNAVVVILSNKDKEEMDDFLRQRISDLKTTRVVTRNGSITNINNLRQVGVTMAKSVIILNDAKTSEPENLQTLADCRIVKAILAVMAANDEEHLPPIIVELHSEQYRKLAENLGQGKVTTLNESDILARILVQTSRNIGLATVYLNLVGFEGNEFYFYRPEKGWGSITFGQLPFHFYKCIPVGIKTKDGEITLGVDKEYQLLPEDQVIILSEDDSTIKFIPEPVINWQKIAYQSSDYCRIKQAEKHLIIGWNNKTAIALKEYAKYVCCSSSINLAINELTPEIQAEFNQIVKDFPEINMELFLVNFNVLEEIKKIQPYQYDSISILAIHGENTEEVDAQTLTILLQLRTVFKDYTQETGQTVKTELIAEIIDSEETDLVIKAGVKDFLLTNQFVSKILAQVSQEPDIMSIYQDLFSSEGKELYIKPISLYFNQSVLPNLTFADCLIAAQSRNEICIGVKKRTEKQDKSNNFGLYLIPTLDQKFHLTINDALITLAEDEF
jgi:ion channel POLLUX/CASTOR